MQASMEYMERHKQVAGIVYRNIVQTPMKKMIYKVEMSWRLAVS